MPSDKIFAKSCESPPANACFRTEANGVLLAVKVVPGSSKTELAGLYGGMLKIKVAAAPEKGKANKALLDFLAGVLHIKKAALQIQSGHTNCTKQIFIEGVTSDAIECLLENL